MKSFIAASIALLAGSQVAVAKEIANPARQEKYDSGLVHETIMSTKHVRIWTSSSYTTELILIATGCLGCQEKGWCLRL